MLDKYDCIIIILLIYLFVFSKKREHMTNSDSNLKDVIKRKINEFYQTDIEAIRKLGDSAKNILENKQTKFPDDLEIRGNLILPNKKIIIGNKDMDFQNIIYHGDQVQLYNDVIKGRLYNAGKYSLYTDNSTHSTTKFMIEKCGEPGFPPFNNGSSTCRNKL